MLEHARTFAAALFVLWIASCATPRAEDRGAPADESDQRGAGAGEDFSSGGEPRKEKDGDSAGSGDTGDIGSGGTGSGTDAGGGSDVDCGSCSEPVPPPTCDHDHDGDCDDADCDHDNDHDCDEDDGGDAHHEGACTFTQGFWKNHPEQWPVASLMLGTSSYSQEQLLAILHTAVDGNGLIMLAHQLIAAKLNVAFGAPDASIASAIAAADTLIGSREVGIDYLPTSSTSALTTELDDFNNSKLSNAQCD